MAALAGPSPPPKSPCFFFIRQERIQHQVTRLTEGEQRHVEYFGPKNVYTALERPRMNTSSRKIILEYFGTISKKVIF